MRERTSLIIDNKFSILAKCDRIVVIDQGKVVEEGKFEDLHEREFSKFFLFTAFEDQDN